MGLKEVRWSTDTLKRNMEIGFLMSRRATLILG